MKNLVFLFSLLFGFNAFSAVKCSDYLHTLSKAPLFSSEIPAEVYNGSVKAAKEFVKNEDLSKVYDMSFSELTALSGRSPKYTYKDMLAFLLSENIERGRVDVVRALLASKHVELNDNKMSAYTPLFQAISKRNIEMLKLLLSDGRLDVNHSPIPQMSPLSYAVSQKSIEMVKLLLADKNLEVNQVIRESLFAGGGRVITTHPLVISVEKDLREIFDLLLSDLRTNPSGLEGGVTTPLLASTKSRDTYYKRALLAFKGIDVEVQDAQGRAFIHYIQTKAQELEYYAPLAPAD
ncbi:MAG: ankyrin repeat domain-containing protein [Bdellovibrionales bacterium]